MDTQYCKRCEQTLSIDSFGSHHWCLKCKATYEANRRRTLGIESRKKYKDSLDKKQCRKCEQYLDFFMFSPCVRGKFGISAWCKECANKHRKLNQHLNNVAQAKRRSNPQGKWKTQHRVHQQKRRAAITGIDTKFMLKLYDESLCFYCGLKTSIDQRTIDHIIAIFNGGLHIPSNLVMACKHCNFSKSTKDVVDFIKELLPERQKVVLNELYSKNTIRFSQSVHRSQTDDLGTYIP